METFVTRDAENIGNLLAFIGRNVQRDERTIKPDPRLEMLIGGEGLDRFYLFKTHSLADNLGEKSILEYIVDNGARMMKQREELLDLLVEKIECVDSRKEKKNENLKAEKDVEKKIMRVMKDEKEIIKKVTANLKLGLPSSIGLTECIKMTEEKFSWSCGKAVGMIAVTVLTNLLGLAFWVWDLKTDADFVDEMFTNSHTNFTKKEEIENCTEFLHGRVEVNQFCSKGNMSTCIEFYKNQFLKGETCREIGPRFEDLNMFTVVAVYAMIHCISPFFFMIMAGLAQSRKSEPENQQSESCCRNIPRKLFKLFGVFPPVTRIVKICKTYQMFKMRAQSDFKKNIPNMEADIARYENSVNISTSVEAATEASPQFFFQTVYLLPTLIISLVGSQSWKELVSHKMISIGFSFTSVAISNYFIR